MVVQTIRGAAALLSVEGAHPEREIDKVTTPEALLYVALTKWSMPDFRLR